MKTRLFKRINLFFFNIGLKIRNFNFLYYKENISKNLINLIYILKRKKSKIYKNFIKNIKKIFITKKNIRYKSYFIVKKENLIYKLKIKRFNTYPKIFIKIIDDYRYLYNRITTVKERSLNSNTFL